jgi:hypothetical protein
MGKVCPEGKAEGGKRGGFSPLGGKAGKEGVLAGNQWRGEG